MLAFLLLLLAQGEAPAKTGGYVPIPSRAQALSPDSKELAFNVNDGTIRFLSLADGQVRRSAPAICTWIDSLAWGPDGETVASIGRNGYVQLLRAKDAKILATFKTFPGSLPSSTCPAWRSRTIDFVDGGKKLFLAGDASATQILDCDSGKRVAEFFIQSNTPITASCMSRDGLHVAVGDWDGFYATYSARTGEVETGPYQGPKRVNGLAFDADATKLAVGAGDCKVRIIPLRSNVEGATLSHCDQNWLGDLGIGWVEFSPDGKKLLATSFSYHEVRLWDVARATYCWSRGYGDGNEGWFAARFAPDPSIVVIGRDGLVLDAATGETRHQLVKGDGIIVCRVEGFYAWIVRDGKLEVWDVRDGKVVADLTLSRSVPR